MIPESKLYVVDLLGNSILLIHLLLQAIIEVLLPVGSSSLISSKFDEREFCWCIIAVVKASILFASAGIARVRIISRGTSFLS